jgi:hypothetical protein
MQSYDEVDALNDIMNHTGVVGSQNLPLQDGCLIKVHFIIGQKLGFNVYKVPRGRTVTDALGRDTGAAGAEHWVYTTLGQADVIIEVTAAKLAMVGFWMYILW